MLPSKKYRHRRGQIPLWFAGVLLAVLLVVVSIWTWYSTRDVSLDGKTQIVFWNANQLGDDVYTALHKFELENPQYTVVAGSSASQDITSDGQRLLCAVAGKVPPDLVWFDRFAIGEWAARGALVDLNPYLEKQSAGDPNRIKIEDYYKFTLDEARYHKPGTDEKSGLFGLPTTLDIRVLFSNSNHLRQAGLVDAAGNPQPPRTWKELQADAKTLTHYNTDRTIARLGFAPNFGNSWLYLYAFQAGGQLLSADGKTVTMDSPGVVRALRFMTDIYDDLGGFQKVDGFQSAFQNQDGSVLDPFLKGQVSMKIDGDWAMQVMAQWKPDMDFMVTPAPMPEDRLSQGVRPVTWAGGFSMVIPSTAREKEGAFKLLQFLSSWKTYHSLEEGSRQTAESEGRLYLPKAQANRKFYEQRLAETIEQNPKIPPSFKNAYAVLKNLLPDTLIRPPSAIGQLLWNEHVHAYEEAVNHKLAAQYKSQGEDAEIKACLTQASVEPQRALKAITDPLPPNVVDWRIYFAGYGILVVIPFIAMYIALKRSRRCRIYRRGETRTAIMFLSPWLIGMICITAGPILFSIVLSFSRYDVISPARYVGFDNYTGLFKDELFYKSLGNTAFMLLRIPLGMAVSLGIAMLLNRKLGGIGGYRTAFYMPTIVPLVAATLLWQALLNENFGLVDIALRSLFATPPFHGIEWVINHLIPSLAPFHFTAPQWLDDPAWCKPSLILMGLWSAGGGMIIWLAGLQAIPSQLYEAATVDGASKWKQFVHVTLPMLSPYILFNAIMGVIGTMQIFTEAFIMFNNGGNDDSALFYAFYLFRKSFQYFTMGSASAMAWILFILVLVLTLIQLYLSKKWVHYDQT